MPPDMVDICDAVVSRRARLYVISELFKARFNCEMDRFVQATIDSIVRSERKQQKLGPRL
jgi:hypothetical protein